MLCAAKQIILDIDNHLGTAAIFGWEKTESSRLHKTSKPPTRSVNSSAGKDIYLRMLEDGKSNKCLLKRNHYFFALHTRLFSVHPYHACLPRAFIDSWRC